MARLDVTLSDQKKLSFDLSSGKPLLIGRGEDADVRVEGDLHVSRRHAEVSLGTGKLKVRRLLGASNPVYQGGTPKDEFELPPGGVFVIGRTRFCYVDDAPARSPIELQHPPDAQAASPFAFKTMSVNDLYSMGAQSPIRWNELLELPAILRQRDSGRFHAHIAQLLRRSTRSSWACVLG